MPKKELTKLETFLDLLTEYANCAIDDIYETDRGSQSKKVYREIDEIRQPILEKLLDFAGLTDATD